MIEQAVDGADATAEVPTPASGESSTSAGALLRRAREAQGLHIAALAVSLKVPVRKLEALESDRHELLTDVVFTRALAASVCRALKIDPAPVMERLPRSTKPELGREGNAQNAPFRMPHDRAALGLSEALTRPAVMVALVLVVGAVLLLVVPGRQASDTTAAGSHSEAPAQPASVPALTLPAEPVMPPTAAPVEPPGAAPASAPAAPAGVPASATAAQPSAQASGTAAAAAGTASLGAGASGAASRPAAAASAAVLGFRTTNPSWIEVTDAQGNPLLRRSVGPQESVEVSGAGPLRVTVGSAANTRVELRGKPFDLSAVTRDNVARFEVR